MLVLVQHSNAISNSSIGWQRMLYYEHRNMSQLLLLLSLLAASLSSLESLHDSYGLNGVNLKFAVYNVQVYFIFTNMHSCCFHNRLLL